MGKRKRTTEQVSSVKIKRPTCHLLSLPPELRSMIWEAVIGTDLIFLYGRSFTRGAPVQISSLTSIFLSPDQAGPCHKPLTQKSSKLPKSRNPKTPGVLSWLRTNRQIYTEAEPIILSQSSLHICDALVFSAFLSIPLKSTIKPENLQSLSICIKATVESDLRDGFLLSRVESHGIHRWGRPGGHCCCPWCFARGSIDPELIGKLTSLRELRLHVYFWCRSMQGNERPVIGHFADGRPRKGQLYRPENPVPLTWVDGRERVDEELAERLCNDTPLQLFSKVRDRLQSVDVQFHTGKIQHNDSNVPRDSRDKCWCLGRSINEQTFPVDGVREALKRILTGSTVRNN
ncbi:hypothetical protein FQN54_005507 [Arachnomyces sp. PD_36]|nr:hypothetical protein FQN54_005507 [Arachnomyces sp. PD_36]